MHGKVVTDKVLFVDDEKSILDGIERLLHKDRDRFGIDTALGGLSGLEAIAKTGPYSIVISDMRMPGMNGAEFLSQVRQKSPETVRMLLTGHTDITAAIDAVNEGNIFRFLTKPCDQEALRKAIQLGLDHYHASIAEKKLVKKAQMIERSTSELETIDICPWDNCEGPTGLPGPTQARAFLEPLFNPRSDLYVVMITISLLQTIEQRYGEEAAGDYLNYIAQFFMQALRADDRLFHWKRDVLLAVVRRQISPGSLRMDIDRITLGCREYVLVAHGKSMILSCPMAFDLAPVSQYTNFDDMLTVFAANSSGSHARGQGYK